MKILLFLNLDIHCVRAFGLLEGELKKHQIKIILSEKVGNINNLPEKLVKMKNIEQENVKDFFDLLPIPKYKYYNVNSETALSDFKNFTPDLIISIRFGQIFKQELIDIPRFGVLNLHSGILPNYRGVLASFWTILNGEERIGTTLHYITDSKIDCGDIIDFSYSKVDKNSSLVKNINSLYEDGCELILKAFREIIIGKKLLTKSQASLGKGNYFTYPKKEDIEKFEKIMPLF